MWRRFAIAVAMPIVFLLPEPANAQTITTGTLSGTVTAADGRPVGGVAVTVTPTGGGASRTVMTEYNGGFRLVLVLPGDYSVLAERLGYRPKLVEQVPVRIGRALHVTVTITPAPPPVEEPERVLYDGKPGGSRAGISQWLSTLAFDKLPWERRETSELAGLASTSTEALETEGLPGWLSSVRIDGLPYGTARHPGLDRDARREIALPVEALQSAELVTAGGDAEWSGFAGGALAVNTRRGAQEFSVESFGSWSGGGLHDSKFIEAGGVANNSLWGGVLLSGPVIRDTAHFVLALEARKLDTPLPRAWQRDEAIDAALIDVGQTAFDVDLEPYTRPYLLQSNVLSGFGRFDWQVANENTFSVRGGFGRISPAKGDADVAAATLPETVGNGTDVFFTASLTSRILGNLAHEIRAGFVKSTRDYENADGFVGGILPSTRVVAGGLRFGNDARLPGRFQRSELNVDQSFQLPGTTHQLKLGVGAGVTWHDDVYTNASAGEFAFSGPGEFGQTRGTFLQTSVNGSPDLKFSILRLGGFIQDVWNAGPGLRLTAGVRVDLASLPADDISPNAEWLAATGLANDSIDDRVMTLSPRVNLTWDVGEQGLWIIHATAGRYASDLDPGILNEVLLADGDLRVRRALGDLGGWPTPATGILPAARPTLTLLGPNFRAPHSDRASFGITHNLGTAAIHVSGTYRYTDFLPRRTDLNLFTTPSAHDQHGRPIFGTLVQIGELLAVAQPNRRFTDFDMVSAVSADGWSRYWGITAAVEKTMGEAVGFFASYTHSRTEDNWLIGRLDGGPQSQLSPFPDDAGDEWSEGTSDFDLPHRVSAGIELRPRMALQPRITAVYRYRSGYPFTPGFRDGVDANGDGSGRNDPAFVDDDIAGAAELIRSWDCLRDQVGGFAERNACRQSGVHSLNARVGLTLLRSAGTSAEVFVDGINLIESTQAEPDRALYLIDRNRSLAVDQVNGTVTTPLVANPHFGTPIVRYGTGRLLRIGLQVNH